MTVLDVRRQPVLHLLPYIHQLLRQYFLFLPLLTFIYFYLFYGGTLQLSIPVLHTLPVSIVYAYPPLLFHFFHVILELRLG